MREILLTQGKVALVDDEDYEWLSKFRWYFHCGYAVRHSERDEYGKTHTILMHREIMKTPIGMQTDHIDMNKLNDQKINMRICTDSENQHNRNKYSNNSSGYKGVSWHKLTGKWMGYIVVGGYMKHLGLFDIVDDAARAYDCAAKEIFGNFARLNFGEQYA